MIATQLQKKTFLIVWTPAGSQRASPDIVPPFEDPLRVEDSSWRSQVTHDWHNKCSYFNINFMYTKFLSLLLKLSCPLEIRNSNDNLWRAPFSSNLKAKPGWGWIKIKISEFENSKTAFAKLIKFCPPENIIWGERKMKIQHRTYISDEEGKLWEVREYFYPMEIKDLVVIYITVNNYYVEQNRLCVKKELFCSHGVRNVEKSLKIAQLS